MKMLGIASARKSHPQAWRVAALGRWRLFDACHIATRPNHGGHANPMVRHNVICATPVSDPARTPGALANRQAWCQHPWASQ